MSNSIEFDTVDNLDISQVGVDGGVHFTHAFFNTYLVAIKSGNLEESFDFNLCPYRAS